MKNFILSLMIMVFGFASTAQAFDFGKRGATFEIKEEGFVAMMIRKLKTLNLEKENEKMKQIAKDRVENPIPVAGIKPATQYREFWHDPTYTLEEDAILPCGKILHKAGTTVNPLDYLKLGRRIIFIDAREEAQIEWVKELLEEHSSNEMLGTEDRIILVGGSVFKLQKELGCIVYFDQSGELTTKWGIKASPALAQQDGNLLKIIEFNLNIEGGI